MSSKTNSLHLETLPAAMGEDTRSSLVLFSDSQHILHPKKWEWLLPSAPEKIMFKYFLRNYPLTNQRMYFCFSHSTSVCSAGLPGLLNSLFIHLYSLLCNEQDLTKIHLLTKPPISPLTMKLLHSMALKNCHFCSQWSILSANFTLV